MRRGIHVGWQRAITVAAGLVLVASLGACSSTGGQGGVIDGTHWILRSYTASGSRVDVPSGVFADLAFDRAQASGFDACNEFTGSFVAKDAKLTFGPLATTSMACASPEGDVASGFTAALGAAASYTASSAALTLFDKNGTRVADFVTAPANPLVGGDWTIDSYLDTAGSVVSPVEGSKPSVTFVEGSALNGTTGCNTFTGAYRISGTTILVGRLATTRMACSDALAAQETAIMAALGGAGSFTVRGDSLVLRDLKGVAVLFGTRVGGPSVSPSPSPSASASPSPTPAASPSPSPTPAASPSPSASPEPSAS